ncbi:MAG: sensor histidine kinase [Ilumatobacteraceae bacterium]
MTIRSIALTIGTAILMVWATLVVWTVPSPLLDQPGPRAVTVSALACIATALLVATQVGPVLPVAMCALSVVVLLAPTAGAAVNSPTVHVVSAAVAVLFLPLVAAASMDARAAVERATLVGCWLAALLLLSADVFVRQPLAEAHCWPQCDINPMHIGGSLRMIWFARWLVVLTAVSVAALLAWAASMRGDGASAQLGRVSYAAAQCVFAFSIVRRPMIDRGSHEAQSTLALAAVLTALGALGAYWKAIGVVLTRQRVRVLTRDLQRLSQPGGVEMLLSRTVDSSAVSVHISPSLMSVAVPWGATTTTVGRGDEVFATITHSPDVSDKVRTALTPVVVTVLENQHMLSAAELQLTELQCSRRRAVEQSDRRRRQLERDLHDGAQQRLLFLGIRLDDLQRSRCGDHADVFKEAVNEAGIALAELRRIAHGAIPPILHEEGLMEALHSMAESTEATVDVTFDVTTGGQRHPAHIERAAYCFVASCVARATAIGAASTEVGVFDTDGTLRVECTISAFPTPDELPCLDFDDEETLDRVGACGGAVATQMLASGVRHEAVFP